MDTLKQPIKTVFLEALSDLRPEAQLEDVEVLGYLHTVEDRGRAKSFAIHTGVALARIVESDASTFVLGSFFRTRNTPWDLDALECGDRFNPPLSPFESFDARPTSAQIASFLSARGVFEMADGARTISEYRADGVPQRAANPNSDR